MATTTEDSSSELARLIEEVGINLQSPKSGDTRRAREDFGQNEPEFEGPFDAKEKDLLEDIKFSLMCLSRTTPEIEQNIFHSTVCHEMPLETRAIKVEGPTKKALPESSRVQASAKGSSRPTKRPSHRHPKWARFWTCGHCRVAKLPISDFHCTNDGRVRDAYAIYTKT